MSEQHRHNLKKGIVFILVAWAFWALVALFVRMLGAEGVPTPMILFVYNLVAFLLTVPIIWHYGWQDLKTKRFPLIFSRALFALGGFTCLFLAVQKISLTNALLLNNSAPLILPIVIYFWLKMKIERKLWIGMIIGFVGICFILKPTEAILNIGALYGLGAAITLALAMLAVRLLTFTEKHHTILFYSFLIGTLIMVPMAIQSWQSIDFKSFMLMVAIGVFAFFGQICFIKAFHYGKASQIGPFNYVGVIYGAILEGVIYHHLPDLFSIIGIVLVCSGGILTILFSKPPQPNVGK